MRKIALYTLATTLLMQGCADYNNRESMTSEIFGKVTIIDTDGKDITSGCSRNINSNGILEQKASIGDNYVKEILCTTATYTYRIKPGVMHVNVLSDNIAVYFGEVTITLNYSGYDVKVSNVDNATGYYPGSKTITKSPLELNGSERDWVRNYI